MSPAPVRPGDEARRVQELLAALGHCRDLEAKTAARELVASVLVLHRDGLREMLGIVDEAGAQPADTLVAKFAANPGVRTLLLLHGLHPQDLATRARGAIEHLRPHLGVRGLRADFTGMDKEAVRIRIVASGQHTQRPSLDECRRMIEDALLDRAPDAAGVMIEGLEEACASLDAYIPVTAITRTRVAAS